jgi:hypothetical protein
MLCCAQHNKTALSPHGSISRPRIPCSKRKQTGAEVALRLHRSFPFMSGPYTGDEVTTELMTPYESTRPLCIAQVAPLFVPVTQHYTPRRRRTYEHVPATLLDEEIPNLVFTLTAQLSQLGHQVTVFASGDSTPMARLSPAWPRALNDEPFCREPIAPHLSMLAHVYCQATQFDVIHCHTDYLSLMFSRATAVPTVITLHGDQPSREAVALYHTYPEVLLVAKTDLQKRCFLHTHSIVTIPHTHAPAALARCYEAVYRRLRQSHWPQRGLPDGHANVIQYGNGGQCLS